MRCCFFVYALAIAAGANGATTKSEIIIHRKDSSTVILPIMGIDSMTFMSGLLAHYPLDGHPFDISGNRNDGTTYIASPTTDRFGDSSGAYFFDGKYGNVVISGRLQFASDFTIAAWVLTLGSARDQMIIGMEDTAQNKGLVFCLTSENKLYIAFGDGASVGWPYASLISDSTISDSVWHHVAVVRKGGSLRLFLNGLTIGSGACGVNAVANLSYYNLGGGLSNCFHGKIDDLRVFLSAQSDGCILSLARERAVNRKK